MWSKESRMSMFQDILGFNKHIARPALQPINFFFASPFVLYKQMQYGQKPTKRWNHTVGTKPISRDA